MPSHGHKNGKMNPSNYGSPYKLQGILVTELNKAVILIKLREINEQTRGKKTSPAFYTQTYTKILLLHASRQAYLYTLTLSEIKNWRNDKKKQIMVFLASMLLYQHCNKEAQCETRGLPWGHI